jgi:ABC-type antimicrobial peptide transport system permease subunit
VRLIEGRFPGSGEVIVGRLAHHVLGEDSLTLGQQLVFEAQSFDIVGIFEAPGTVMASEVWMDRNDLMSLTQRTTLSCVIARLESEEAFKAADLFAKQRLDLELSAMRESDYYAKVSAFFGPIRAMTWLTAGLISAGAVFGGFNMLYAAFASRIRELATLQAVGFTRTAVFISLVQESLLATLTGTLCAAFAAVWLLEGQTIYFSIGTFSLQMSGGVVLAGLLTGLLLGILGSIPPAVRCLGTPLPTALRS